MSDKKFSVTSDKKFLIVTENGNDVPYNPVLLERQKQSILQQQEANNNKVKEAIDKLDEMLNAYAKYKK